MERRAAFSFLRQTNRRSAHTQISGHIAGRRGSECLNQDDTSGSRQIRPGPFSVWRPQGAWHLCLWWRTGLSVAASCYCRNRMDCAALRHGQDTYVQHCLLQFAVSDMLKDSTNGSSLTRCTLDMVWRDINLIKWMVLLQTNVACALSHMLACLLNACTNGR